MNVEPAVRYDRATRWAIWAAITAAILAVIWWILIPTSFYRGYLAAFVLLAGVPLGSAAILMTHVLTGGRWGLPLRPLLEAAILTVPLLAILFIPVLLGMRLLYPWTDPQVVAASEVLHNKEGYLNVPFFVLRAVVYFTAWIAGGFVLVMLARRQDEGGVPRQLPPVAAAGLIVYVLTATFAGIDWVASREPEWYSSIFGIYTIIGQVLTALSLVILALGWLSLRGPRELALSPSVFYDLGTLLIAMVVFHAYLAYFQFSIMWHGNVRLHVTWYAPRIRGVWGAVAVLLILIHFALPFAALLSRRVKRDPRPLMAVAALIVVARAVESAWSVIPTLESPGLLAVVPALAAAVALGGLWLAAFMWVWRRNWPGAAGATP